MSEPKPEWKLVTEYGVVHYICGLSAGDVVRLKKEIVVRDYRERPTGEVLPAGGLWNVLSGSKDDPGIVWLRQPDGARHTWVDDPSIFEWFEKYVPS